MNSRQMTSIFGAIAGVVAASAAAWGQPTHLWIGITFAAVSTACTTIIGLWNKVQ